MDKIRLVNSDTATVPRGSGTLGSRSLQTAGSAVHVASNEVLAQGQADRRQPARSRRRRHRGRRRPARGLRRPVARRLLGRARRGQRRSGQAAGRASSPGRCATSSTSTAATRPIRSVRTSPSSRSTPRPVSVRLVRHVAVDDCGRILNPLLVAGQQHGGIAQGAAQALFEEVAYDDDGNPITSNLADYGIPSAAELPSFEVSNTQTDSPRNPIGAKGIGESGTIGSTPAIQNAVVDAVSHLGVKHVDMPCSAQRVWRAISEAKSSNLSTDTLHRRR